MKKLTGAVLVLITGSFIACSTKPILDEDDVKLEAKVPSSSCQNLGTVTGRTMYATGTRDEAVKDMKRDAASKGANYIKFEQYSGTGTVVTGTAYKCL